MIGNFVTSLREYDQKSVIQLSMVPRYDSGVPGVLSKLSLTTSVMCDAF